MIKLIKDENKFVQESFKAYKSLSPAVRPYGNLDFNDRKMFEFNIIRKGGSEDDDLDFAFICAEYIDTPGYKLSCLDLAKYPLMPKRMTQKYSQAL